MTVDAQTLLSTYRKKHGGAYDKIDDATLLGAIQKKYPRHAGVTLDSKPPWQKVLGELRQDAVPLVASAASGFAGGIPQAVAENPASSSMAGLPGAFIQQGRNIGQMGRQAGNWLTNLITGQNNEVTPVQINENDETLFTEHTPAGKIAGLGVDLASGALAPKSLGGIGNRLTDMIEGSIASRGAIATREAAEVAQRAKMEASRGAFDLPEETGLHSKIDDFMRPETLDKRIYDMNNDIDQRFPIDLSVNPQESQVMQEMADTGYHLGEELPSMRKEFMDPQIEAFKQSLADSGETIPRSQVSDFAQEGLSEFPEQAPYAERLAKQYGVKQSDDLMEMTSDPIRGAQYGKSQGNEADKILNSREIQYLIKDIFEGGNPLAKRVFDRVLETNPKLAQTRAAYKTASQTSAKFGRIKKSLPRLGTDRIGPDELKDLKDIAKASGKGGEYLNKYFGLLDKKASLRGAKAGLVKDVRKLKKVFKEAGDLGDVSLREARTLAKKYKVENELEKMIATQTRRKKVSFGRKVAKGGAQFAGIGALGRVL